MNSAKLLIAPLLAGALSACAVTTPLEITSTGAGSVSRAGVALSASEEESVIARQRFASALERAFAEHSVPVGKDAPLLAEYSVSIAPASSGVVEGKPQAPADGAPAPYDWVAEPRKKGRFDRCSAQRIRGVLVLFKRADGSMTYKGEATGIACEFSDADMDALADLLVADALGSAAGS